MEVYSAVVYGDAGRLRHFLPGSAQIPQWFRYHHHRIVGDFFKHDVVRIVGPESRDVGAVEERS